LVQKGFWKGQGGLGERFFPNLGEFWALNFLKEQGLRKRGSFGISCAFFLPKRNHLLGGELGGNPNFPGKAQGGGHYIFPFRNPQGVMEKLPFLGNPGVGGRKLVWGFYLQLLREFEGLLGNFPQTKGLGFSLLNLGRRLFKRGLPQGFILKLAVGGDPNF